MQTNSDFDPRLIRRYDVSGPRYTSYPPATQFSSAFQRLDYEEALQRSHQRGGPLSLYLHVPFCESPCFFCGCNKIVTRQASLGALYLERLLQEIGLHQLRLVQPRPIRQLHLGGGTPTWFDSAQLGRLIGALDRSFGLVDDAAREYSIEIDPRQLRPHAIADLAALGFNRISLGVQDFDPQVQKAVNRIQSFEETELAVTQARMHGIGSIGIDLICGLPLQTEQSFLQTLEQTLLLQPDRLSLYSYAHLPQLFKPQQRIHAADLPTAAVKLRMMQRAVQRLAEAGYEHIGMDHFARRDDELTAAAAEGRLQRNFQGYSTHAGLDLIGLGVSAISQVDGCYAQNARRLDSYYALLDHARLPVERGLKLSTEDRLRARIIQSLMCGGSLDIAALERAHGIDFRRHFSAQWPALQDMAADGLVEIQPSRLQVTARGRYLLRAVAMLFDGYLPQATADRPRYSKVI